MASSNLVRPEDLTPEERRASASRAGKASVAARRRKKDMRRMLQAIMDSDAGSSEDMENALAGMDTDGSVMAAILCGQLKAAARGDARAMRQIVEIAGVDTLTTAGRKEQKARIKKMEADLAAGERSTDGVQVILGDGVEDYCV